MSGTSKYITREAVSVQSTFELIKKGWDQLKGGVSRLCPAKYPGASMGSATDTLMQLLPLFQTSKVANAAAPI
jgi:hypothetical protein